MWIPVRVRDSKNWYALDVRSGLICGPAGLTREQAQNWCNVKNTRPQEAPVLPGRLDAVVVAGAAFAVEVTVDGCTARYEGPTIADVLALREAANAKPDTPHVVPSAPPG